MSLCINPACPRPENADQFLFCQSCGSELLLHGRYRCMRLLGSGGFGKTYEIYDTTPQSPLTTFKILKVLMNDDPKAIELFQREAEVLGRLRHPGIPQVEPHAYWLYFPRNARNPMHCLVMEKIEGLDLYEYMKQRGYQAIDEATAVEWLTQLAQILHPVHQQRFFHRDIKPANIMLRPNGQLALIDFGSVREVTHTFLVSQSAGKPVTGIFSQGYTPPEQMNGQPVTQSDFYALGRTFVFLLTGKEPTSADLYDPYHGELRWRNHTQTISPALLDLIDAMMARLPGQRPSDTATLLHRLAHLYDSPSLLQPSAPAPIAAPQPQTPAPLSPQTEMEFKRANRRVRAAWLAGIFQSLMLGFPLSLGAGLVGILAVVPIVLLTIGIFNKSRVCSILMLLLSLLFLVIALLGLLAAIFHFVVEDSSPEIAAAGLLFVVAIGVLIIFLTCYVRGILGTFAYHRLMKLHRS